MLRTLPIALLTLLLAACGGATPVPDADESASPTPTATATADTEETDDAEDVDPEPEPEPEPGLSAADRQNVRDAITWPVVPKHMLEQTLEKLDRVATGGG